MENLRFFMKRFILTLGRLCQQRWLLAELVLLCLFLPLALGSAAEQVLSRGVDFSGIRLAVTAPEGDELPRLLEEYMGRMEDITRYCTVEAMDEDRALRALEEEEITAVLQLPENFVQGILWGDNPDVQVLVGDAQPVEALLTLWVGQSASDFLAAFQAGIYAVLDVYDAQPLPGLTRDQVVEQINLEYGIWALRRHGVFEQSRITATGALPVREHYSLCILLYFALSLAPLFVRIFVGEHMAFERRLRCAGRGAFGGYAAGVLASAAVLAVLLVPGALLTAGRFSLPLLLAAVLAALFCGIFASFCCLAAGSAAGCGLVAFAVSLAALILAGGIIPPVLLPATLRKCGILSPVTWLLSLLGGAMGYNVENYVLPTLLTAAALLALGCRLYCRRVEEKEGSA